MCVCVYIYTHLYMANIYINTQLQKHTPPSPTQRGAEGRGGRTPAPDPGSPPAPGHSLQKVIWGITAGLALRCNCPRFQPHRGLEFQGLCKEFSLGT